VGGRGERENPLEISLFEGIWSLCLGMLARGH